MIVGFQIILIGLLADAMSGMRKLVEDVLYRIRRMELAATRRPRRARRTGVRPHDRRALNGRPGTVSVVIPAMNEAGAVGDVVRELAAAARWHEILVIDDGSADDTGAQAEAAGARVIRHPYNKGNGAAVKTGIRAATGEYILIIDGDGQHRPADAVRLTNRLGEYDLVVGARSSATQAGSARRWGNAALNWLAGFLTEREIPDLTSGFRAARRDQPARVHPACCRTGSPHRPPRRCASCKAGYSVAFEPVEARQRVGTSKISLSSDGPKFLLIMLRVITIFSPFRIFLPIAATAFLVGAGYAVWTIFTQSHVTNSSVLLIVFAVDGVPRRSRLRADLGAAFRWPSMKDEERRGRATRRWIAAAALAGFALRLAFGLSLLDQPAADAR